MLARIGMALFLIFGFVRGSSFGKTRPAQDEEQGSSIRFKLRGNYQVIVPVSVNGLEPVSFILDTGTKTTMLDERICGKLGLSPVARMPLTSFTGTTMVTIVRLDSLSLGRASAKDLEVSCADLRKAFSMDSDVYGVLGQNFLARFSYLLDYRGERIVLDTDGALQKDMLGTQLAIEPREYRDYVLHDAGSSVRQPVRFLLDSGSRVAVIFGNLGRDSGFQIEREAQSLSFAGALGSRSVETGRIPVFRIGSETINNLSVRLTPALENEHRWENGLLPTSLFRAIYFNHEKQYVILNPRFSQPGDREQGGR